MFETEFEFTLPKGYLDSDGILHRQGVMRLATAMDEIAPLKDLRVRHNPAYATVIILARVITKLGTLDNLSSSVIEQLYACDLNYLQNFYRQVNELELEPENPPASPTEKGNAHEGETTHPDLISAVV